MFDHIWARGGRRSLPFLKSSPSTAHAHFTPSPLSPLKNHPPCLSVRPSSRTRTCPRYVPRAREVMLKLPVFYFCFFSPFYRFGTPLFLASAGVLQPGANLRAPTPFARSHDARTFCSRLNPLRSSFALTGPPAGRRGLRHPGAKLKAPD